MTEEQHAELHQEFNWQELQAGSPFVLEFGPIYDRNVDLVTISFRDQDGLVRTLSKPPIAPRDTLAHTYELSWGDEYAIYIDGELASFGRVSQDFELEG